MPRQDVSRTTLRKISSGLLVVALLAGVGATARAQQKPEASLYKRLGGYDAIAAVVDDFIGRLLADKQLSRFFTGVSTDSRSASASWWSIKSVRRQAGRASTSGAA